MVSEWFWRRAKWWQFWLPQSGVEGGMIFGGIVAAGIVFISAASR
jgi:hypothetical protein